MFKLLNQVSLDRFNLILERLQTLLQIGNILRGLYVILIRVLPRRLFYLLYLRIAEPPLLKWGGYSYSLNIRICRFARASVAQLAVLFIDFLAKKLCPLVKVFYLLLLSLRSDEIVDVIPFNNFLISRY